MNFICNISLHVSDGGYIPLTLKDSGRKGCAQMVILTSLRVEAQASDLFSSVALLRHI